MHRSTKVFRAYWRVFYTAPRIEKKCEERLLDRGIDVFLPKCVEVRQWGDRRKKVVAPLFPSYLFAHVDEADRLHVLRTDGIVRCVSFGGRLAEMREDEIEQLKLTQQAPDRLRVAGYVLPPIGDQVTVTDGPLQGLRGEVLQHRGQLEVLVRVGTIRQAVKVQVPANWVCRDRNAA